MNQKTQEHIENAVDHLERILENIGSSSNSVRLQLAKEEVDSAANELFEYPNDHLPGDHSLLIARSQLRYLLQSEQEDVRSDAMRNQHIGSEFEPIDRDFNSESINEAVPVILDLLETCLE